MKQRRWIKLWLVLLPLLYIQNLQAAEIAIIKSNDIAPYNQAVSGFKSAIQANFQEYDLKGQPERALVVMTEIERHRPQLIFAIGSLAVTKAQERFADLPIVCTLVLNAEARDLSRNNMTSISIEIEPKTQLKALSNLAPKVRAIGLLYSKSTENIAAKANQACKNSGIDLVSRRLESPDDLPQGIEHLLPRIDALWLIPDGIVVNKDSLQYLLLSTLENRIPFLVYSPNFVKSGALLSVSVDYTQIGRQAALVSQKILQGESAPSGILPPEGEELAINLNTARRLGIKVPAAIMGSAKYVFE